MNRFLHGLAKLVGGERTPILLGLVFGALLIGYVSDYFLADGNPVEVMAEEIIKEETGLTVDLDLPQFKR